MQLIYRLCFLILGCTLLQGEDLSYRSKPTTLKVLIEENVHSSVVEVRGRYTVFNPLDGTQISSSSFGKRAPLLAHEFGIQWNEKFPGIHHIRIIPGDSQSSILINGIQYKGSLDVYASEGKIDLVNEIDVENFLKSTLTLQFPEPILEEAMNAIAIVARTNAYALIGKKSHTLWHVAAQESGYQGYALTQTKNYVDKAVDMTRRAILTFESKPFYATWTKDSAGKTADFASIFRKSLVVPSGVEAPLAAEHREDSAWKTSISKESLAQIVNVPVISSIDLYQTKDSEKVYAIRISGEGQSNDIDFFTLQKVLGTKNLRSNDFTVFVEDEMVVFSGFGEGPGVGLCLYSAQALASQGEKAPSILSAFFPETQLQR